MEDESETKVDKSSEKAKKHPLTYWALGMAGVSFLIGGLVGIIPIITIVISIVAITKTRAENSGRRMAVTALVIGIIYLILNAYNNGHLGNRDTVSNHQYNYVQTTPVTGSEVKEEKIIPTVPVKNPNINTGANQTNTVTKSESAQCRGDKLNYDSCREHLSHKECISTWDYEMSCGTISGNESPSCRSTRLNYEACREHLSHTSCISTWDYESACGLVQNNESSQCRSKKLNYESCREHLSEATCLSTWDYVSVCN